LTSCAAACASIRMTCSTSGWASSRSSFTELEADRGRVRLDLSAADAKARALVEEDTVPSGPGRLGDRQQAVTRRVYIARTVLRTAPVEKRPPRRSSSSSRMTRPAGARRSQSNDGRIRGAHRRLGECASAFAAGPRQHPIFWFSTVGCHRRWLYLLRRCPAPDLRMLRSYAHGKERPRRHPQGTRAGRGRLYHQAVTAEHSAGTIRHC